MNSKTALLWLALPLVTAGCTTMEAQIKSSGTMGPADADYASTAYDLVQLDNQAGALAATKSTDPRVQLLASTLVMQASVFAPTLQSAMNVEGVKPPKALSRPETAEITALKGLSGPAFDHQYVADELAIHQRAVAVMQKEDAATSDGALRTQVEAQLPSVQGNLSTLQVLSDEYHGKAQG